MSLASYLRAAPKVELHLHLEGSLRPATVLELAARRGVPLPPRVEEELRQGFAYGGFDDFVRAILATSACLRAAEDYERAAVELARELARQNVRYAEVTTTPALARRNALPVERYLEGLERGRRRALAESGVELAWVLDIVRNLEEPARSELAELTTEAAIAGREAGVVGLGLAGVEAGYPAAPHARRFERARAAGLASLPHAGETGGPGSVREALDLLGAERIGHGVRAAEEPALVARLAREGVALEVCPTSNLRLGLFPDLAAHPLRRLHEAGVVVTVNSDDPALFGTTLADEVLLLASGFGLGRAAVDRILVNAARASRLPEERRRALVAAMEEELAALARLHLGAEGEGGEHDGPAPRAAVPRAGGA